MLEALKENLDFFAWTSPLPDHAEHIFRDKKINERQYLIIRKGLDSSLDNILKAAEKVAENIVIMSDHGKPVLLFLLDAGLL